MHRELKKKKVRVNSYAELSVDNRSQYVSHTYCMICVQAEPLSEPAFPLVGPASCVGDKGPVEWVVVTHFEQSQWAPYV